MKKILLATLGMSALIISLSVAYYFVVFLPQKETAYERELKNVRKEIQNVQNVKTETDTSGIESRLEDIEYSMQEQERDQRMQNDCESTGGIYEGNGICVFR